MLEELALDLFRTDVVENGFFYKCLDCLYVCILRIHNISMHMSSRKSAQDKHKPLIVEDGLVTIEGVTWTVLWIGDHPTDGSKHISDIEDKPKGKVTLDDGCASATLSFHSIHKMGFVGLSTDPHNSCIRLSGRPWHFIGNGSSAW